MTDTRFGELLARDIQVKTIHDQGLEIERLTAALKSLLSAAKNMPLWTPSGGGASTKHSYQIAAAEVWALDREVAKASATLSSGERHD